MPDPAYDLADAIVAYLNHADRSFPIAPAAFVSTDPAEDLERETATLKTLVIPFSETEEPAGRTITQITRAVHVVVVAPIGESTVRDLADLVDLVRKSLRHTDLVHHSHQGITTLERLDFERVRTSNLFVSSFQIDYLTAEEAS